MLINYILEAIEVNPLTSTSNASRIMELRGFAEDEAILELKHANDFNEFLMIDKSVFSVTMKIKILKKQELNKLRLNTFTRLRK